MDLEPFWAKVMFHQLIRLNPEIEGVFRTVSFTFLLIKIQVAIRKRVINFLLERQSITLFSMCLVIIEHVQIRILTHSRRQLLLRNRL